MNSRFRPAEIVESIVLPSRVISDQYKSVTLATQDGKVYGGMPIVSDGPNLVLLLSDGTKVTIPKAEIEEQKASTTSVMPEGLLNPLSYQEIADLLALFDSMPRVAVPESAAGKGEVIVKVDDRPPRSMPRRHLASAARRRDLGISECGAQKGRQRRLGNIGVAPLIQVAVAGEQ